MKIDIITSELKDMVSRVVKGASCDKLIPLTNYIGFEVKDNVLCLRTTDGANFLSIYKDKVKAPNISCVLPAASFAKLVSKTTSEHIILTIEEGVLTFKGNGYYHIELVLDENGDILQFPDVSIEIPEDVKPVRVKQPILQAVYDICTASLAKTIENPVITGYYFNDRVMTTDSLRLCVYSVNVFKRPALLPIELLKLSTLITEEDVQVYFVDNDVIIKSKTIEIAGTQLEDIESYPVEALDSFLETEFPSTCTIKKSLVQAALDRLSIFVSEYDKNTIKLLFTKTGLKMISSRTKAEEIIPYDESDDFKEFECLLDIVQFKELVNTLSTDIITLSYGTPTAIKMVEGKVVQILSSLDEDIDG